MFRNFRPNENCQNSFHPVGGNAQPQPQPQPQSQPVVTKSQDVNDILKRLHANTEGARRRIKCK